MNEISGKVVAKESGLGIPGLLVMVVDVGPGARRSELVPAGSQEMSSAAPALLSQGIHEDRLGSVLTDRTGSFRLRFEDDAFQARNPQEKRPALRLTVLAPEDVDSSGNSYVPLVSSAVRQNAGRTEQYLIRLSADQLSKAGVIASAAWRDSPQDSGKAWNDYNHKQEFEHELINRKTTWLLTTQGVLFAAYGLTFSGKALPGVSHFRTAVAATGLVVASLTLIGVTFLILSKWISFKRYQKYFDHEGLPAWSAEKKRLGWGAAGKWYTMFSLAPDLGMPVVFIVAWSMLLP